MATASVEFIHDLESASAEGDSKTVTELFERSEAMELLETPQIDPERCPKYYQLDGALVAAARHNHPAIASYFLSKDCIAKEQSYLQRWKTTLLKCFNALWMLGGTRAVV